MSTVARRRLLEKSTPEQARTGGEFGWPNPCPQTFGYQEFFYAFTVAAAACHYVAVWAVLL